MMAAIRMLGITTDTDRHGNVRYYFRRRGLASKTRLPGIPGSPEFLAAYGALIAGHPLPAPMKPIGPAITNRESFAWLCQKYLSHWKFREKLDTKTKTQRISILTQICQLTMAEGDPLKIGDAPFADMPSKAIRRIRDRKSDTPHAADAWLKSLKALFKWACEEELATTNPTTGITKIASSPTGWHAWTIEEVQQWEAFYPVGSTQRLALALLLYTGCRREDVIAFGPQHVRDGWITYTQNKNRNRKPVQLSLPVLPELAEIIAATKIENLAFLTTERGRPFTGSHFGKCFRQWADAAGLEHCTPHGIRKAGAVRAAENGATVNEMKAIFGWSDGKQAELYTRSAEQKKLAGNAMGSLSNVSHFPKLAKIGGTQTAKKP